MIKYQARVTSVGAQTAEFIQAGILVLFGPGAPEELAEFAVLHDGATLSAALAAGDTIVLDGERFAVLAVGEVANTNLAALGHLVLKFNGQAAPELPGDVCVEAKPIPPVTLGMLIQVEGGAHLESTS